MAPDPHLTGFLECFNRQAYYEAHDVLEELWLKTSDERRDFYKGLIQTAAVFLKLQQGKPDPADAFGLAGGIASAEISRAMRTYQRGDRVGLAPGRGGWP